jgi:hypothetical protein
MLPFRKKKTPRSKTAVWDHLFRRAPDILPNPLRPTWSGCRRRRNLLSCMKPRPQPIPRRAQSGRRPSAATKTLSWIRLGRVDFVSWERSSGTIRYHTAGGGGAAEVWPGGRFFSSAVQDMYFTTSPFPRNKYTKPVLDHTPYLLTTHGTELFRARPNHSLKKTDGFGDLTGKN